MRIEIFRGLYWDYPYLGKLPYALGMYALGDDCCSSLPALTAHCNSR